MAPLAVIRSGYARISRYPKVPEIIAHKIVQEISRRGLRVGHQLPSESVMMGRFSVGRSTLRESLRLLEVNGLLSIRTGPGGGPVVATADPAHLGRMATLYFQMAGATYRELYDAWLTGEGLLAEWAARNPDAALRREVLGPYIRGEETSAEDPREYPQFHNEIASLASNRVLAMTLQAIAHISAHHVASTQDYIAHRDHNVDEEHQEIGRAIAHGSPRRARELMESHMRSALADPPDQVISWL